jgi:hypothetical protein
MTQIHNIFLITLNQAGKLSKAGIYPAEQDKFRKVQKLILLFQKQAIHFSMKL